MFFPENQQLFTVSEMTRACGVSRTTLIRIEECGVLTPCHINPETGYRYYNAYNAAQVGQYLLLQSLGMTREEIAKYYYQKAGVEPILQAQRERLDRMRRVLEELEVRSRGVPGISFSYIDLPEQTCFCLETELSSPEEGERFFYKAHEQCIREGFRLLGTEPLFGLSSDNWRIPSPQSGTPPKTTACIPVDVREKSDPRLIVFPAIHAFSGFAYGDYSMIGKLTFRFWQEIDTRGIRPAGPARFYGLVAPYTGNHLAPEHYCYRMVVPVREGPATTVGFE
ncbi:MAG: MerR family transcriptional regulator [Clostridia bacterium]